MEKVLPRWGDSRRQAVAGYQRFVWEGLGKGHRADFYKVKDQRYLGDDGFVDQVEKRVLEGEPPQVVEIEWAEVRERVCREFGVLAGAVLHRGRGREDVRIKRVMAWVGREVGGFTNQQMAKELRQDPAVLSRGLSQLADGMKRERELQSVVEKLCNALRKGRRPKRCRVEDWRGIPKVRPIC